jgi:hypothetical protein
MPVSDYNEHEEIEQYVRELSDKSEVQLEALEKTMLARLVDVEDSPDSFDAFYELVMGHPLSVLARKWIDAIYTDKAQDRGELIWSFRGSWKTTTITVMFTTYRIGKEPHRANLILRNNDKVAQESTAAIAKIIEYHWAWKLCFPYVVPDRSSGWGDLGYQVMRTDMDYPEWVALNSARSDPSFLGLGITSGSVIGKHPDGVLAIDDIHDEGNTSSATERGNIIKLLTSTVFRLAVKDVTNEPGHRNVTWFIAVGTPWTEDDAYHYIKDTGEYGFVITPVMRPAAEGDPGAIYVHHGILEGWYVLNWPDRFPLSIITSLYNETGGREFGRMFLLQLGMGGDTGLKYHSYPAREIDLRWPTGAGVDYASTIEIRGKVMDLKSRSRFAEAIGMKLPTGGIVVYDGVSGHMSQLEGENQVVKVDGAYPNFIATAIEMNGKGEELYALLTRHPMLRLLPFWTGLMRKPLRHERILSPWLENGMVKISDNETPFLNELRKALREWPNGSLDEIDAVYALTKVFPEALVTPNNDDTLDSLERKPRTMERNPFCAFGGD